MEKIRTWDSGANRNASASKRDIEGFISPIVLKLFSDYMHENRFLADGSFRDSDNWQNGIPIDVYHQCLQRHVLDVWLLHRGYKGRHDYLKSLNGALFNIMGLIHEYAKEHPELWEFEEGEL